MKCPNCDETLVMTERQGVEIDYCPKCRGVWLDKGELDKIIEKASSEQHPQEFRNYDEKRKRDYDDDDDDNFFKKGRKGNETNYPQRKRGGFLGNLFDFD